MFSQGMRDPHMSASPLLQWQAYCFITELMPALHNGMVHFINRTILELHGKRPIGVLVLSKYKHARSVFVQPVANL